MKKINWENITKYNYSIYTEKQLLYYGQPHEIIKFNEDRVLIIDMQGQISSIFPSSK